MQTRILFHSNALLVVALWTLSFGLSAEALEIEITYSDTSPIPGFNDPVLGSQRQAAFQKAIDIWETHLQGTITVKITADFTNFPEPELGILGSGLPASASANLTGLPLSNTWYHSPLASQLRGVTSPAGSGPLVGFHMAIAFEDSLNTGPVGSGIFYYGLDGNPPVGDRDFVSVALHELGHCLGMAPLINRDTGQWANLLDPDLDPPPALLWGDIYSRHLTRTPNPVGGPTDIDFWDMFDAERLAAVTSDEVYWMGAAVMAAAEFAPPQAFPQINSKGEVQMSASSEMSGSALAHWEDNHFNELLMKPKLTLPSFPDIDATKEIMIDIGWLVNTAAASGPVAWVDFGFVGEGFGSEILPFNSFGRAVTFVTAGGIVNIKAGSSTETPTVSKAMTVNAVGGSASIGVVARSAEREDNEQSKTGFVSRQNP